MDFLSKIKIMRSHFMYNYMVSLRKATFCINLKSGKENFVQTLNKSNDLENIKVIRIRLV